MHVLSFLSVALVLLALLHRYAWARLVRDTHLPPRWRRPLTVAVVLLFVAVPASLVLLRDTPVQERSGLTTTVFAWIGLLFYLALFLLAADLFRLLRWSARRFRRGQAEAPAPSPAPAVRQPAATETAAPAAATPEAAGVTRRELFARGSAGIVLAGAGATALAGWERRDQIVSPEVPVRLSRLPRELDGLRLVQLSDVHLGLSLDRHFLRQCVERANALRPDAIVITGDLVDSPVELLGPELAPLADLKSRFGTFFITGNHEYYSGADEWVAFLRAGGVKVLLNERATLGDAASLDLAGVTDWSGGPRHEGHTPDLPRALAGRDPSRELVLLAHQPRHIDEAAAHDVGLQISGHTHGGQMWPFGALVGLVQPYVAGLHRHTERTQIYVSRGTGFWGPPMRVAAPAEIACLVLTT